MEMVTRRVLLLWILASCTWRRMEERKLACEKPGEERDAHIRIAFVFSIIEERVPVLPYFFTVLVVYKYYRNSNRTYQVQKIDFLLH